MMRTCLTILILCIFSVTITWAQHGDKLSKEEFDKCVAECGDQLEKCMEAVRSLWLNFSENRKRIVKMINRCCLQGQLDHSSPSTSSFAACVRNNCNAQLWGCNIKKRHSGFLSKEEQEYIKQKEMRDKLKKVADKS